MTANDSRQLNNSRRVPCFPLHALLVALNRSTVDYFSLDVEGFELEVGVTWNNISSVDDNPCEQNKWIRKSEIITSVQDLILRLFYYYYYGNINVKRVRPMAHKISKSFFKKILSRDSCLHSLLPPERNTEVLTKRYQSFLKYALAQRFCVVLLFIFYIVLHCFFSYYILFFIWGLIILISS